MKKHCFFFALILLPFFAQAQKLDGLKGALERGASGGDGGGGNNSFWFDLFFNVALEPTWWLFYGFPGETPARLSSFNSYPYADGENGVYLPPDDFEPQKRMSLQLTGHLQADEDAVYGGYFQARWSPNRAINLEANRLQLLELLDNPDGTVGSSDHFSITNFNLSYNRVHHRKFQLWWGGGLMLLNPGKDALLYGSPSVNGGFSWYIKRPISLYADGQIGYPNGVIARQNQVRVQMHLKRFMVYAGMQGTRIGDVRMPSMAVGTGVWF